MTVKSIRRLYSGVAAVSVLLAATGCSGAGGGGGTGGEGQSINVLMVGNPQMEDIQKLTADSFTKDTGIKVNFTVLPENELRDKVTQDVANLCAAATLVSLPVLIAGFAAQDKLVRGLSLGAVK
jgi:sorbitol/mannitol transport system substrate-binding protein